MIGRVLGFLAVATALAAFSATAFADDPVLLRYGDPGPTDAAINAGVVQPWADEVNKEGDGALKIQVFVGYSLVNMVNTLDRVKDGVADIAFCIMGPVSSQFPRTMVATLPFEAENAHEAGLALQRLYANGVIAEEWKAVRPIAFGVFANTSYHSVPVIRTMDDLKGVKISVQGRLSSQTLQALGGTPISLPINEVYEALQRNTVQGAAIGWPAAVSFKLTDFAHNHVQASLGGEAAAMIMNNDSYAKLTGKAKAAIDANSGTVYTDRFDKVIDDTERDNTEITRRMGNQTIYKLPPDELSKWKKRVEPVIADWVKNTPDGANVLAAFRKEIAAIRAGS